jgi:uncharacterized membrane protein
MTAGRMRPRGETSRSTVSRALWIVQGLLALLFLFAGGMKLVVPLEKLAGSVPLPGPFMRFIGVAEVLGAIGLILPGLLRIRPGLTPLVVGLLSAFVAYGRWRLAPHRGSSQPPVLGPAR